MKEEIIVTLLHDLLTRTKQGYIYKIPADLPKEFNFTSILDKLEVLGSLKKLNWSKLLEDCSSANLKVILNEKKYTKYIKEWDLNSLNIDLSCFNEEQILSFGKIKIIDRGDQEKTIQQAQRLSYHKPQCINFDSLDFLKIKMPLGIRKFIINNLFVYARHQFHKYDHNYIFLMTKILEELHQATIISSHEYFNYIWDNLMNTIIFASKLIYLSSELKYNKMKILYFLFSNQNYSTMVLDYASQSQSHKDLLCDDLIEIYKSKITVDYDTWQRIFKIFESNYFNTNQQQKYVMNSLNVFGINHYLDKCSLSQKKFIVTHQQFNTKTTYRLVSLDFGFKYFQNHPQKITYELINHLEKKSNLEYLYDLIIHLLPKLPEGWWKANIITDQFLRLFKDRITETKQWPLIINNRDLESSFLVEMYDVFSKNFMILDNIAFYQDLNDQVTQKYHSVLNWSIAVKNPRIKSGLNQQYLTPELLKSWVYQDDQTKLKALTELVNRTFADPSKYKITLKDHQIQIIGYLTILNYNYSRHYKQIKIHLQKLDKINKFIYAPRFIDYQSDKYLMMTDKIFKTLIPIDDFHIHSDELIVNKITCQST